MNFCSNKSDIYDIFICIRDSFLTHEGSNIKNQIIIRVYVSFLKFVCFRKKIDKRVGDIT